MVLILQILGDSDGARFVVNGFVNVDDDDNFDIL